MRWREKRHNSLGLPLVIRSWGSGAVKEGGLDELGVQGLFTKILIRDNPTLFSSPEQERVEENFSAGAEAAAEWLAEHSEMKKELSRRSAEIASGNVGDKYAFKVIVDVIARACKGAVVIFDQFEEILRVGEPVVNQVSALIAHLVSLENVRVVLSLRQEHLGDLKYIERNVTPLGKSTIHLEIMPLPTAKDALDRMGSIWAHKNGYKGFEVAAEMLRALRPSAGVDDGADLIYYQAILLQMWECLYGKEIRICAVAVEPLTRKWSFLMKKHFRKAFRNELEGGADLKADHIFEIALSKIMASVFTDNMLLEYIAVRIYSFAITGWV